MAGRIIEVDRLADRQDWYGGGRERAGCIQIERGVSAPSDENSRRKVQNVGANSTINKIRGPHVYQRTTIARFYRELSFASLGI